MIGPYSIIEWIIIIFIIMINFSCQTGRCRVIATGTSDWKKKMNAETQLLGEVKERKKIK